MGTAQFETFPDLLERRPEKLAVMGFRCCMAGYDFCDAACWEAAWLSYIGEVGQAEAPSLMGELQYWIRSLRRNSRRPLTYYPQGCRYLCFDECMALAALSAAQSKDELAGMLAVQHLTGLFDSSSLAESFDAAKGFAGALLKSGQPLYPVNSAVVESIAKMRLTQHSLTRTIN
jgi:hypothetical protein